MAVINKDFAAVLNINTIQEVDIDIRNYIINHHSGDFDEIIAEDTRWEVFYHLSSMRSSLFNWYDFEEGAELLEVGGGFGSLTGVFCDRCKYVTTVEPSAFHADSIYDRHHNRDNLDIYVGNVNDIIFEKQFDYVILVDVLEKIGRGEKGREEIINQFLSRITRLLKPNGKILISTENRFGLRYFCGAISPYSERPFAGLSRSSDEDFGVLFSKQELIDILVHAGLENHKFYYPLPDYKFPQLIYTDAFPPQSELKERLIPYYVNSATLVASEKELYEDIIKNHVFDFFSNSFLVECTIDGTYCPVMFASVTTDRGKEHGFATIINENKTVLKSPLFNQGRCNLKLLYRNLLDIQKRGLKIVPHDIEANGLRMPYVNSPTLSKFLGEIIETDKDIFLELIDKLYDCILSSSDPVDESLNNIRFKDTDLNYGVILKRTYLDMIPFNCFYINHELVFFDQEFVRDYYPAKYVLFRALMYIYITHPKTENIVPLQTMKQKYGLTELWVNFEKEEAAFVSDNRNHRVYKYFYSLTSVDKRRLSHNQNLLQVGNYFGDPKEIEKLHKIHMVQLDLLKTFIEVCEKHQLRYFAVHGTLLGAVRHRGFIPWDDDMDIAMPREDFEKLKRISKEVFNNPYILQTNENDPEIFYGSLSRLRNSNTTGIEYSDINQSGNLGIWIDIMAIDFMYKDPIHRSKQLDKIIFWQKMLLTKTYGVDFQGFNDFPWKERKKYYYLARFMSRKWLLSKFHRACTGCTEEEAGFSGTFTRLTRKENIKLVDKRVFRSSVPVQFERIIMPAPNDYHHYLSSVIGKDYMKFPPIEKRTPSHPGVFLADIPYKRFTGTFRMAHQKKFIIFGSGQMFEHYLQNFGSKYPPKFIVDNNPSTWGLKKHGIMIKNPLELLNLKQSEIRIVICSIYFREIGKQLEEMGINEYYIYIQNKEWL